MPRVDKNVRVQSRCAWYKARKRRKWSEQKKALDFGVLCRHDEGYRYHKVDKLCLRGIHSAARERLRRIYAASTKKPGSSCPKVTQFRRRTTGIIIKQRSIYAASSQPGSSYVKATQYQRRTTHGTVRKQRSIYAASSQPGSCCVIATQYLRRTIGTAMKLRSIYAASSQPGSCWVKSSQFYLRRTHGTVR